MWQSEDSFSEVVFFFHHVGPKNSVQDAKLEGEHPHLLSCLTGPDWDFSTTGNKSSPWGLVVKAC